MTRRVACILALSLAPVFPCVAQNGTGRRLTSQPEIAGKVGTLREFVNRYARRSLNTFHIARAESGGGEKALYVYWKEDNSILILELFDPRDSDSELEWLHHKARINLATDVVPTREAIGASTFLVDRPWVNRIIKACLKGEKLIIRKQVRAANRRGRQ